MTSYHESGHAIYCLLHYMRVESVHISENKRSKRIEGFTNYYSYNIDVINDKVLFNKLLNTEICVSYAGMIAEKHNFKLLCGSDKFPLFLKDGSSEDTLSASNLIKRYKISTPGKRRQMYKKRLVKIINKELQDNWEAVIIVAHELINNKKIYFSDLKKILLKKSKNKIYWKEQFKLIDSIYNNMEGFDEKKIKDILSI